MTFAWAMGEAARGEHVRQRSWTGGHWYFDALSGALHESQGPSLAVINPSHVAATDWEVVPKPKPRAREMAEQYPLDDACIHSVDQLERFARTVVEAVAKWVEDTYGHPTLPDRIAREFLEPRK